MIEVAEVFMVAKDGSFLMQHRDDKPDIYLPGKISAWGGRIEDSDKLPRAAAAREGKEETNLDINQDNLEYFGETQGTKASVGEDSILYWFVLKNVNPKDITVLEGQGVFVIKPGDDLSKVNLSDAARSFIDQNMAKLRQ